MTQPLADDSEPLAPMPGPEPGPSIVGPRKPGRREAYIPVRKSDLIEALCAEPALSEAARGELRQVCRLLAASLHYSYFEQLETMREAYFPFDPETDSGRLPDPAALDAAWERFDSTLRGALVAANFEEINPIEESLAAKRESESGVHVKTSGAGLRAVRYFVRERRRGMITRKRFWGLRRERVEADVFGDVILVAGYKAEHEMNDRERTLVLKRGGAMLRPACAFVKQFRQIARGDLHSLHPGARITMKRADQVFLAAPALVGGVPLIMNLLPALSVLFLVIGAYLGFQGGQPTHDSTRKALAALSGLVALGAFLMRQRLKFEAQKLRYQKKLSDNIYYRNVANNAGVFDSLVGAAEEQELKEAAIAYQRLLVLGPLDKPSLDRACEQWLITSSGAVVDFEVEDALRKLVRLGLVIHKEDQFAALPPEEALENLDTAWDRLFEHRRATPAP